MISFELMRSKLKEIGKKFYEYTQDGMDLKEKMKKFYWMKNEFHFFDFQLARKHKNLNVLSF